MLITSYEPEIVLPPCDFGREEVNVIGHVAADISPVFPYRLSRNFRGDHKM